MKKNVRTAFPKLYILTVKFRKNPIRFYNRSPILRHVLNYLFLKIFLFLNFRVKCKTISKIFI